MSKKQRYDPDMDPAFPYHAVTEVMHKNRDYIQSIAASLSHVDEDYQDAVAEYVFWAITRKASELRHRPRHSLQTEE